MRTSACSGRFASTALRSTTDNGSTSTLSAINRPTPGGLSPAAPVHPSVGLLLGAALAVALGLLGYNVVVNDRISIASVLILLVSLAGLAHPITEWLGMSKAIRQANRSARGIFEFLERRPELHQDVGAQFLNALKEQIRIDNVSVESRSGRRLLEAASVEIPANARSAVIGLDEDSKLALACLIPRLLDPISGRVLVDGHDLREVTLDSVRVQVATVLQADLIFTDSVLVNIGLGDPLNNLATRHRSRQGGPCPSLHPGLAPRL